MIATRRRGYTKEDDAIVIIHPAMQYFEVTTTEENETFNVFYADTVTRYILDGVEMNSNFGYANQYGFVTVPTPGFHQIYAGCNGEGNYNSRIARVYGTGVLRPKRYTTQFQNPPTGAITKLMLIQTTPLDQGGNGSLANLCSNLDEVLVPEEAVDAYKAHRQWAALANKIKGVKYKIIED